MALWLKCVAMQVEWALIGTIWKNRMIRALGMILALGLGLAACSPAPTVIGPDGRPAPGVYKISKFGENKITYRMLDSINELRAASGSPALQLNAQLNAAAATHSRDMHVQNRPWHFGSDGSSPIDRVRRVGYSGHFLGETISESYETELETLTAWLSQDDTRAIILDPRATELGFAWYQEQNGKLWWCLTTGTANNGTRTAQQIEVQAPLADTRPNRTDTMPPGHN